MSIEIDDNLKIGNVKKGRLLVAQNLIILDKYIIIVIILFIDQFYFIILII